MLTKLGWGKALLQRHGWTSEQKAFLFLGTERKVHKQLWWSDHRILETSTGFLQMPYSQPVKAVGALFKTAVLQSKPSAYKLEFLLKLPRN